MFFFPDPFLPIFFDDLFFCWRAMFWRVDGSTGQVQMKICKNYSCTSISTKNYQMYFSYGSCSIYQTKYTILIWLFNFSPRRSTGGDNVLLIKRKNMSEELRTPSWRADCKKTAWEKLQTEKKLTFLVKTLIFHLFHKQNDTTNRYNFQLVNCL